MGLFLFLAVLRLWAAPAELEVWFLSPPATGQWSELLSPRLARHWVAQACEPVGDFCLDPKGGLYPKSASQVEDRTEGYKIDEGLPQLPTATSVDRSLINCDSQYVFDIFCGQAQAEAKGRPKGGLEVWVDTSSSLRSIDSGDNCQRKKLLEQLAASCPQARPVFKGFDTSLRDIGPEGACGTQGLNNAERLMEWIEVSSAHKLVIITDVYEYQSGLANFLESKKAQLRGDSGTFPATRMQEYVSLLAKSCGAP